MQKILFLGSHIQSYKCFKYLYENFSSIKIEAISPHVYPTEKKDQYDILEFAKSKNIKIIDNKDLEKIDYDLGISLLYDKVLKKETILKPKKGFINFHMGPLPRFRGSNSVMHAIINARKENNWNFAVTTHYMVEKVDQGPIIDEILFPIYDDDTAHTLHKRASNKVYDLFVKNIHKIIDTETKVNAKAQVGKVGMYYKGVVDHEINLDLKPIDIYDRVRALTFPEKPKPYFKINGKKIFLDIENDK